MLETGQVFANFKILGHLGAGGMGEVYLAEDQKLNRQVALKILLDEFFEDSERLQRFEREAKTAAQISHPNIMGIYDMGKSKHPETGKDVSYIVMERVKGKPLFDYMQSTQTNLNSILRLGEKIAAGLAAAHKLNIVHRDIKSSNILVDDEGTPKILDFGLAKPLDTTQMDDDNTNTVSQELTKEGKIVGTISYMSPEQARGEKVDSRSDLFSFGVLLYHMVTSEFPFSGSSQVATLAKILETKHEAPSLKNQNINPELERIIDKCLQKNPNDRYQSAADLVVDLRNLRRQYDSGISESLSGISSTSNKQKYSKTIEFSWKGIAGIAAVIIVVAIAIYNWSGSDESATQPDNSGVVYSDTVFGDALAIFSFENKTKDTTLDWLETGLPDILMTDLVQSDAISIISTQRIMDFLKKDKALSGNEGDEIANAIRDAIGKSLEGIPVAKDAIKNVKSQMRGLGQIVFSYSDKINAARSLGAANVLSGSFYKMGDKIRIDARLEDIATGKIVFAEKVVGDDPFTMVDSLTNKIASSLNIQEIMNKSTSVASMITEFPEAYKLYYEGMKLFSLELNDEAILKFERAIEIDPTFAMAYMRVGMCHVFEGRGQEGSAQFAIAQEYKNKLPIRERSKLELYSDVWLIQDYDAAFKKLATYVDHYPDDKEIRTIYAMTLQQFNQDTPACFAQLDTVLAMDPGYQLALSFYSQIYQGLRQYDQALDYIKRIRKYHPESPEAYFEIALIYESQDKYNEAIAENEIALELFPNETKGLSRLSTLYIRKRNFEMAEKYLEKYRKTIEDDHFLMVVYFYRKANIEYWRGKFNTATDYYFKAIEEAFKTNDSTYISGAYSSLSSHYDRLHNIDSSLYFDEQGYNWTTQFKGLNYAISVVESDYTQCEKVRPILEEAIEEFKSVTPSSMWPIIDKLVLSFDAYCLADTIALIKSLEEQNEVIRISQRIQNIREIGILKILTGDFKEGKDLLKDYVFGDKQSTNGFRSLRYLYLMGIANEGLGNTDEAIKNYEEVLTYWGDPEIEIREIKDLKARLAKLTS